MKQLFVLLCLGTFIISCNKDSNDPPKTAINRDRILVSTIWQIQRIHALQNNTLLFYQRGGQNNNWNYDSDYLKFEKDGSGTYTAGSDVYVITWQFDNSDKTEISYTVHDYANGHPEDGIDLEIKLENVYLSETSFRYAELYTNENGTHTISSVYREPKTGSK